MPKLSASLRSAAKRQKASAAAITAIGVRNAATVNAMAREVIPWTGNIAPD